MPLPYTLEVLLEQARAPREPRGPAYWDDDSTPNFKEELASVIKRQENSRGKFSWGPDAPAGIPYFCGAVAIFLFLVAAAILVGNLTGWGAQWWYFVTAAMVLIPVGLGGFILATDLWIGRVVSFFSYRQMKKAAKRRGWDL